jgi:hypothetical protein
MSAAAAASHRLPVETSREVARWENSSRAPGGRVVTITVTVERVSEGKPEAGKQAPTGRGGWDWLQGTGMSSRGKEQGSASTREPSPDEKALKDYDQQLFQKFDQELLKREEGKGGGRGKGGRGWGWLRR